MQAEIERKQQKKLSDIEALFKKEMKKNSD